MSDGKINVSENILTVVADLSKGINSVKGWKSPNDNVTRMQGNTKGKDYTTRLKTGVSSFESAINGDISRLKQMLPIFKEADRVAAAGVKGFVFSNRGDA